MKNVILVKFSMISYNFLSMFTTRRVFSERNCNKTQYHRICKILFTMLRILNNNNHFIITFLFSNYIIILNLHRNSGISFIS